MKTSSECFFRRVPSLALLVLLLRNAPGGFAQTLEGQPRYQATGLRTILKAQPNSTRVRVRYESNTPGPVQVELRNDQRRVVYTERKRETQFVGDYDLARLPAGDYTLQVSAAGFHHVDALRLHRASNARATVQVIELTAWQLPSHSLLPPAVTR